MHSLSCELRRGSSESYEDTETPRTALSLHDRRDPSWPDLPQPVTLPVRHAHGSTSWTRCVSQQLSCIFKPSCACGEAIPLSARSPPGFLFFWATPKPWPSPRLQASRMPTPRCAKSAASTAVLGATVTCVPTPTPVVDSRDADLHIQRLQERLRPLRDHPNPARTSSRAPHMCAIAVLFCFGVRWWFWCARYLTDSAARHVHNCMFSAPSAIAGKARM